MRYSQEPKADSPLKGSIFRTTVQNASCTTSSASCSFPVMLVAKRYARSPYVVTRRSAAVGSCNRSASRRSRSRSARGRRPTVLVSGSRIALRLMSISSISRHLESLDVAPRSTQGGPYSIQQRITAEGLVEEISEGSTQRFVIIYDGNHRPVALAHAFLASIGERRSGVDLSTG